MDATARDLLTNLLTLVLGGGGLLKLLTWLTDGLAKRAHDRRASTQDLLDSYRKRCEDAEAEVEQERQLRYAAERWAAQMEAMLWRQGSQPPPRPGVTG